MLFNLSHRNTRCRGLYDEGWACPTPVHVGFIYFTRFYIMYYPVPIYSTQSAVYCVYYMYSLSLCILSLSVQWYTLCVFKNIYSVYGYIYCIYIISAAVCCSYTLCSLSVCVRSSTSSSYVCMYVWYKKAEHNNVLSLLSVCDVYMYTSALSLCNLCILCREELRVCV